MAYPTLFELRRGAQILNKTPVWHPFASYEEWELAEWIIESEVTQCSTDRFLKSHLVRESVLFHAHTK